MFVSDVCDTLHNKFYYNWESGGASCRKHTPPPTRTKLKIMGLFIRRKNEMNSYAFTQGKSNRAYEAIEEGKLTILQITPLVLRDAGIKIDMEEKYILRFTKFLIKEGTWETFEYHHHGKTFTKVKYYDLSEMKSDWERLTDEKKAEKITLFFDRINGVQVKGQFTQTKFPGGTAEISIVKFSGLLKNGKIEIENVGKFACDFTRFNQSHPSISRKKSADGSYFDCYHLEMELA